LLASLISRIQLPRLIKRQSKIKLAFGSKMYTAGLPDFSCHNLPNWWNMCTKLP
jgi:hypothetical protein